MLAAQERRLQAYQRAQAFVKTHADAIAGTGAPREIRLGLIAQLDDFIALVHLAAAEQESGTRASQAATQRLRAAIDHLRFHYLKHLAVIASAVSDEVVGIDQALRLPRNKTPVTQLLAQANAMLAAAAQHEALMVRWGMKKDFVAAMRRAIDAVSHEVEQRDLARLRQAGATAALQQRLNDTKNHIDILEANMLEAWEPDSTRLAEWRIARSVHKARRRTTKEGVNAVGAPAPQLLLTAGSTIPVLAQENQPDAQRIRRRAE